MSLAWMKNGFPILQSNGRAMLSDACCCETKWYCRCQQYVQAGAKPQGFVGPFDTYDDAAASEKCHVPTGLYEVFGGTMLQRSENPDAAYNGMSSQAAHYAMRIPELGDMFGGCGCDLNPPYLTSYNAAFAWHIGTRCLTNINCNPQPMCCNYMDAVVNAVIDTSDPDAVTINGVLNTEFEGDLSVQITGAFGCDSDECAASAGTLIAQMNQVLLPISVVRVRCPGYVCYAWYATYSCASHTWAISSQGYLSELPDGAPGTWIETEPGRRVYYVCGTWTTPPAAPTPPTDTLTCCWWWTATYDCETDEYFVSGSSGARGVCDGTESLEWVRTGPGQYEIYTHSADEPAPPSDTQTCVFVWSASFDCAAGSWTVALSSSGVGTDAESDWSDPSAGYSTRVTHSATQPSPPTAALSCIYYWSAYYDCETAAWQISGYGGWPSSEGAQPWSVYGTYADCTTTTSTQPAAPTETPSCE